MNVPGILTTVPPILSVSMKLVVFSANVVQVTFTMVQCVQVSSFPHFNCN